MLAAVSVVVAEALVDLGLRQRVVVCATAESEARADGEESSAGF